MDNDTISRQAIIEKLQKHHDFFVNAYNGFENMPSNIKLRVDEITNCIAEVVNMPPVQSEQKIVITTDGKTTTARMFEGKKLIKSAEAKCNPKDKFDFETGAKIAFDRLVDREEKVKPKDLLKNGVFGKTNEDKWFVFVDGMFVYEDGNYDIIEDINENLIFCYKGSIRPVNVLVKSNGFKNAKLNFKLNKDVIWRR